MPAPWRLRRTVLVGSEKTLPSRSLPIRRMGISLGMRLLLRTTCCGMLAAMKEGGAGQFSTNRGECIVTGDSLLVKTVARRDECFNLEQATGRIGIGGVVAHSPLPHDRTCGSASGGSAGRTNHEP